MSNECAFISMEDKVVREQIRDFLSFKSFDRQLEKLLSGPLAFAVPKTQFTVLLRSRYTCSILQCRIAQIAQTPNTRKTNREGMLRHRLVPNVFHGCYFFLGRNYIRFLFVQGS